MTFASSRRRWSRLPRPYTLRGSFFAATVVLAGLAAAPPAFAQATGGDSSQAAPKPKKKPKKKPVKEEPKPSADETPPAAPATDADSARPAGADEAKPAATDDGKPAADEPKAAHDDALTAQAGTAGAGNSDTREDPNKRYYFVGLRYRGTIIPQFILNLFVDEGTSIYSNMFGAEFDIRKGGQSMIPWIVYSDYSTGDMLFHQKGSDPGLAGNYTVVHSSLKMIILGLDELWSVPIDPQTQHFDFEFGFGVGIGFVFGDLGNNWVTPSANNGTTPTPLRASTGVYYVPCATTTSGVGCSTQDHQNASTAKVGGYKEPFLFSGGSVPNIFPNVWFPTLALRYKPVKQFQARLGLGFSLTGFWFGLSGDYGLESTGEKPSNASASPLRMRDML
ncbi:MAG: hypothetical protein JOZ69_23240 [Myxococcales bacterium]|nr:hypothetical protein [Myxococcales bacterium]